MSLQSTVDRILSTTLPERIRRLLWPVWNTEQRRLRAPIRALVPTVLTFLLLAILQTVIRARFDHPVRELLELTGIAVILVGAVLLSARLIDRRPVKGFGLSFDREWWRSFVVGGLVATAINGGALVVALGADWAAFVGVMRGSGDLPFVPAMGIVFGYIAFAAAWEEFVLRGAMVKNLAEGSSGFVPQWTAVGLAVALSTIAFAFLHGAKVTHLSQYGYYLIAGLVLSGVYVLTGELALSIGFHVFYNFTQSAIFGLGHSQRTPELLAVDIVGPSRWVGEEGLLFVSFAVLGGLLLVAYIFWRDGKLEFDDRVTRYVRR
ncbi:CPBP family intramembrane metalloprotease domain-containing protein [Halorubrum ezzemoulense DSM 17463]|uniref:CPBP family intramembrane metalloprotease domain-containing protein n=1 Tax=Halorubrum ezzemoulense DSM 17463 TaxID=1121945 RepID=A0A1X4GIL7_HALEZ|nr:type II CAAX endopeptidase family protein [Halorubrum ezzemoulense]OSO97059.1 CPBP family intramembrane metalloprotease domain-containing protein [Halorubrum ezzemoulense DSM 17463]